MDSWKGHLGPFRACGFRPNRFEHTMLGASLKAVYGRLRLLANYSRPGRSMEPERPYRGRGRYPADEVEGREKGVGAAAGLAGYGVVVACSRFAPPSRGRPCLVERSCGSGRRPRSDYGDFAPD